jgi:hypothetical protein
MIRKPPRPEATGNPLDMSTHPTVPKARAAILSAQVGGGLTGQDRKLFNFLLAVAYPNMLKQNIHEVFMADARAFLGAHESNDQIRASLRRLASVILDFDYTTEDGEERFAVGGLLSASGPKGEGIIRYQFGIDVAPMLAEPAVFARLKLAVLGQFVSKYAGILYELLELRANLKEPEWSISVDDFRALVGAINKITNFSNFRKYALAPALDEINDKADLAVSVTEQKQGRKVIGLTFTIEKKPFREAMEAEMRHKAIQQRKGKTSGAVRVERSDTTERDTNTLDLLDGRTDRERGGFPPLLTSAGIEEARAIFASWGREAPDIYYLEKEWMAAQEGREPPRNPDAAFVGWCKRWKENRPKTIRKNDWD